MSLTNIMLLYTTCTKQISGILRDPLSVLSSWKETVVNAFTDACNEVGRRIILHFVKRLNKRGLKVESVIVRENLFCVELHGIEISNGFFEAGNFDIPFVPSCTVGKVIVSQHSWNFLTETPTITLSDITLNIDVNSYILANILTEENTQTTDLEHASNVCAATPLLTSIDELYDFIKLRLEILFNACTVSAENIEVIFQCGLDTFGKRKAMFTSIIKSVDAKKAKCSLHNLEVIIEERIVACTIQDIDLNFDWTTRHCQVNINNGKSCNLHLTAKSIFVLSNFFKQLSENVRCINQSRLRGSRMTQENDNVIASTNLIAKFYVRDINARLELEVDANTDAGNGVSNSTDEETTFILTVSDLEASYHLVDEALDISAKSIASTVGYVHDGIRFQMVRANRTDVSWDLDVKITEIVIQTSQHIVEKLAILFKINTMLDEYSLLYNESEQTTFNFVNIQRTHVTFSYYNSPYDKKKLLRGHWKHIVKLIPHCDLDITFPLIMLKYKRGINAVIEGYVSELLATQKVRCVKKIIAGTAKRKWKSML